MSKYSTEAILALIAEHRHLRTAGDPYSAVLRLARAAYFAKALKPEGKAESEAALDAIEFTADERKRVIRKAETETTKLLKVFSNPQTLVEEELYLIVSMRIDLGLLSDFVSRYWKMEAGISIKNIDREIRDLRRMPTLQGAFNRAVKTIERNSGVILRGTSVDELAH